MRHCCPIAAIQLQWLGHRRLWLPLASCWQFLCPCGPPLIVLADSDRHRAKLSPYFAIIQLGNHGERSAPRELVARPCRLHRAAIERLIGACDTLVVGIIRRVLVNDPLPLNVRVVTYRAGRWRRWHWRRASPEDWGEALRPWHPFLARYAKVVARYAEDKVRASANVGKQGAPRPRTR